MCSFLGLNDVIVVSTYLLLLLMAPLPMQLLDALSDESSPTQLEGDIMIAALRVCAKSGAWQSAIRVWERLQGPPQQSPQQQPHSAQQRGAAAQLVLQACRAGKNASKAAELTAEFKRLGLVSSSAS